MSKNQKKPSILDKIKNHSVMIETIIILGGVLLIFGLLLFVLSIFPIGRISYVYEGIEYSYYRYNLWKYWYLLVPSLFLIALEGGIFYFLIEAEIKDIKIYLIYLIVLNVLLIGVSLTLNIVVRESGAVSIVDHILMGIIHLISIALLCASTIELTNIIKKLKVADETSSTETNM